MYIYPLIKIVEDLHFPLNERDNSENCSKCFWKAKNFQEKFNIHKSAMASTVIGKVFFSSRVKIKSILTGEYQWDAVISAKIFEKEEILMKYVGNFAQGY